MTLHRCKYNTMSISMEGINNYCVESYCFCSDFSIKHINCLLPWTSCHTFWNPLLIFITKMYVRACFYQKLPIFSEICTGLLWDMFEQDQGVVNLQLEISYWNSKLEKLSEASNNPTAHSRSGLVIFVTWNKVDIGNYVAWPSDLSSRHISMDNTTLVM